MPGQVEAGQPVLFGHPRVGHQPMKLAAIGAGGVQAEHIAAGSGAFAEDAEIMPGGTNRHIAASQLRRRPVTERRAGGDRGGGIVAERQPFADFQHAADDVAVLGENQFLALDGEFPHLAVHGEDGMVVARRDRQQELVPDRVGRGQSELRRAIGAGDHAIGEGETGDGIAAAHREIHRPGPSPGFQHGIDHAGAAPTQRIGKAAHDGSIRWRTAGKYSSPWPLASESCRRFIVSSAPSRSSPAAFAISSA